MNSLGQVSGDGGLCASSRVGAHGHDPILIESLVPVCEVGVSFRLGPRTVVPVVLVVLLFCKVLSVFGGRNRRHVGRY